MTRHNLGFMLVDLLAREANAQVKRKDCRALVGRAELEGTTRRTRQAADVHESERRVGRLSARQAGVEKGLRGI